MGATAAVAGQNLGAGHPERTVHAVKVASRIGLVLAVIFGAQRSPESAAALGATLGRKPLEAVRQSYETRALRNAVESHRFAVGSWPRSLDQLVTGPLLADSALAGVEARPYYYVKREDGVILLAPER